MTHTLEADGSAAQEVQSAPPPYLAALNAEQRAAVEALDGPLLVLAGAGTGKTRVLTTRLAHILESGRAWPGQVLAVTFTNKAAREMIERVEALVGRSTAGLWLGTFHAVAARILRRHAELADLKSDFTILDMDDQLRIHRQLLREANLDEKRWPPRALSAIVQRWKDRGLGPDRVADAPGADFAQGRAPALYAAYQQRLRQANAVDFGDLLLHGLEIFTKNADVLAEYQTRFRYLLVDEYQDTNIAQYLWLRLLAQTHRNICCVGDDDQSIYGWRGAEVGNILKFERDFPGARIIRLERNYRSTGHILAAASGLIARNTGRLGKTLWTEDADGEKVRVAAAGDGRDEAWIVGEEIEALQHSGEPLGSMAILVRASFQTRAFEERFLAIGLPYRVVGGLRFYERQEIRDAVAYIRVLMRPDDDLAFERIVNLPKRGLGEASLRTVREQARSGGLSLYRTAEKLVGEGALPPRANRTLGELLDRFRAWRTLLGDTSHEQVVETMLEDSGYLAMWRKDRSPAAPGRLENLEELAGAVAEFPDLASFLDHVSLVMEREEGQASDMVSLMTLHGAKGLEFDTVFLPGWEEGLFPHQLALQDSGAAGLEEERRLAYVGLTRARRRAFILFAANRLVHDRWVTPLPSRFLEELPPENLVSAATRPPAAVSRERSEAATGGFGGGATRGRASATPQAPRGEARASTGGGYQEGARIFHQKFGYGVVRAVDGDKLRIAFDKAGPKTVMDSYVQPADRV